MRVRPVAVVSNAGNAVGRAAALELAAAGHDVAVIASTGGHIDELAVDLLHRGARAVAIEVDRHEMASMQDAAAEVERRLGEIEIWIEVASFSAPTILPATEQALRSETFRPPDNSYATRAMGVAAAINVMTARNRGVVVWVNSAASYRPEPDHPTEAAEAFALRGFVQALRTDVLRRGLDIRLVNVVAPAPMLRAGWGEQDGHAEQVVALARAIARASRGGRQHHVHRLATWLAVLGARVAPGVSDHLAALRSTGQPIARRSAAEAARELATATTARAREILHPASTS